MRQRVVVLIAASIGAGAQAGASAAPGPSALRGEVAWARATWPEVFRGVRFRMPLAKLLTWAPRRGSIPVYLYRDHEDGAPGTCREVELERDQAEDDGGDTGESPTLTATIASPTRVERSRTVRDVGYVSVGQEMSQERLTTAIQAKDARGRWKVVGGTSIGVMPTSYGWLSYADDRIARWDAEPLDLHIECPVEWLACPTGGGRPCRQCERAVVSVQETGANVLRPLGDKALPATSCRDECPAQTEGPDIARLRRLADRVHFWRPRRTPIASVPSLFRSLDDCLREHPSANQPRPGAR